MGAALTCRWACTALVARDRRASSVTAPGDPHIVWNQAPPIITWKTKVRVKDQQNTTSHTVDSATPSTMSSFCVWPQQSQGAQKLVPTAAKSSPSTVRWKRRWFPTAEWFKESCNFLWSAGGADKAAECSMGMQTSSRLALGTGEPLSVWVTQAKNELTKKKVKMRTKSVFYNSVQPETYTRKQAGVQVRTVSLVVFPVGRLCWGNATES